VRKAADRISSELRSWRRGGAILRCLPAVGDGRVVTHTPDSCRARKTIAAKAKRLRRETNRSRKKESTVIEGNGLGGKPAVVGTSTAGSTGTAVAASYGKRTTAAPMARVCQRTERVVNG